MNMGNKCAMEVARSVVSPFDYASCIPDGAPGSTKFTTKLVSVLATGASGTCYGVLQNGNIDSETYLDTGSNLAAPSVAGNWLVTQTATTLRALFSRYRLVSMGIRIYFTGSTMNDPGVIIAGQLPGGVAPSVFNAGTLQALGNLSSSYRVAPLRNGMEVTWRPTEKEDQDEWVDVAGAASAVTTILDKPCIYAYIYGASTATASTCYCETVCNYEGQYKIANLNIGTTGIGGLVSKAEVGWYEVAKNLYHNVEPFLPYWGRAAGAAAQAALPLIQGFNRPPDRGRSRASGFIEEL